MKNQITFVLANTLSPEQIFTIAEIDTAIPAEYDPLYKWDRKAVLARVDMFLNLSKPNFFEVALQGKVSSASMLYRSFITRQFPLLESPLCGLILSIVGKELLAN